MTTDSDTNTDTDTDTENPLTGTEDLSPYTLRDHYQREEPTNAEVSEALESESYSLAQLKMMRKAEKSGQNRKGAQESIDDAEERLEAKIAGEEPESEDSEDEDLETQVEPEDTNPESNTCDLSPVEQKAIKGAGATDSGTVGVCLPNPYGDDAPDTVKIDVEARRMSFAGEEYEHGTHDVVYSMRVKQSLEADTNNVYLSSRDPLHPASE